MVKGVNKNVIEINDTGSEIFERIVFYVSPAFSSVSRKRLLKETDKFSFCGSKDTKRNNSLRARCIRRRRRFLLAVGLGIAVIAAAVTAIIIY